MKKDYSKSIQLRCVVCGSDSDFEYNDDKSYIKCRKCNREYPGGYDELVELNRALIDEELEHTKNEIVRDARKELNAALKKSFKGSEYFKIK